MQISISDAKNLAIAALTANGLDEDYARITADHLAYAAMSGHEYAGLPRVVVLLDQMKRKGSAGGRVSVVRETASSAVLDGADVNGYVTSFIAMEKALEIARRQRFAVVGVNNSWFSGVLKYYTERAAEENFIAIHTANVAAIAAPYGGRDKLLGTNPIGFSFPSDGEPLTIDFGTTVLTWGDVLHRKRKGEILPEGAAIDSDGNPTTDPEAALSGALLPWGGHKGFGLMLAVQALGILSGSKVVIDEIGDCGFFFLLFDPELLMPLAEFKAKMAEFQSSLESARPAPGRDRIILPGKDSRRRRAEAAERGTIEVHQTVYDALVAAAK